ncbi:MAG: hypothetical protein FJW79_05260 [Actinobacteria bacterium]|nr:hypothetical protein [Actinomycetota bacterium]
MDKAMLSTGQRIVYYGGWFLVVNLLFIPWYRAGGFVDVGLAQADGFGAGFYAWGGSLFGIAAAVLVYLKASGKLGAWQFKPEYLVLLFTLTSFVLILVRLATEANSVFLGTILGMLAAAAMTFGAFLDSGLKLPQAKPAGAEAPPPPPPPPPA